MFPEKVERTCHACKALVAVGMRVSETEVREITPAEGVTFRVASTMTLEEFNQANIGHFMDSKGQEKHSIY